MTKREEWIKLATTYRDNREEVFGSRNLSSRSLKVNPDFFGPFGFHDLFAPSLPSNVFAKLCQICRILCHHGKLNNWNETTSETGIYLKVRSKGQDLSDAELELLQSCFIEPAYASFMGSDVLRWGIVNTFIKPMTSHMTKFDSTIDMYWWKSPNVNRMRDFLRDYGLKQELDMSVVDECLLSCYDNIADNEDILSITDVNEGYTRTQERKILIRNRHNRKLYFKEHINDKLCCYICDHTRNHTEINASMYEVAHKTPLFEGKRKTDPKRDLMLLCRNCHGQYTYLERQSITDGKIDFDRIVKEVRENERDTQWRCGPRFVANTR